MIRAPDEIGDPRRGRSTDGTLTWHFTMEHTRDVAFAASPAFAWDAARINLPDGKTGAGACRSIRPRARAPTAGAARPNI